MNKNMPNELWLFLCNNEITYTRFSQQRSRRTQRGGSDARDFYIYEGYCYRPQKTSEPVNPLIRFMLFGVGMLTTEIEQVTNRGF